MFQKFQLGLVCYLKHTVEVVLHIWLHCLNRYIIDESSESLMNNIKAK